MDIVDQYYWLGYAKKQIDTATDRINDAAAKISTLVASFWTIYTTTFVIGSGVKKLDETRDIMVLLILPIPLLIFSYMSALWAQMPGLSLNGVDPRSPDDVMKFYSSNMKWKKTRLILALIIFFTAGISLSVALVFANFTHDKTDHKSIVSVTTINGRVMVSGDLKNKTMVVCEIETVKGIFKKDTTVILQNDHFDHTMAAPQNVNYNVTLTWKDLSDPTISNTYVQSFSLAAPPKSK